MKLLCINSSLIQFETKDFFPKMVQSSGENLIEGEMYETEGKKFINDVGAECYYIKGIGAKLCCRFIEVLPECLFAKEKLQELILN